MTSRRRRLAAVALASVIFTSSLSAAAATLVSCPFDPLGGGDQVTRGFYVTNYPGATLDTVTLQFEASVAESKTIQLTARTNAYDGPLTGTVAVTAAVAASATPLVFDFGNVPVTPGSTVTFAMLLTSGAAPVFYNVGVGPCAGVTETEGTSPPLDTFRRNSVGVIITGDVTIAAPAAEIPFLSPLGLAALAATLAVAAVAVLGKRQ